MNKIWVYLDHFNGEALGGSWEALGAGRMLAEQLGGGVTALVFGHGLDALASLAFQSGADEVLLADDATLRDRRHHGGPGAARRRAVAHDDVGARAVLGPRLGRDRTVAGGVARRRDGLGAREQDGAEQRCRGSVLERGSKGHRESVGGIVRRGSAGRGASAEWDDIDK